MGGGNGRYYQFSDGDYVKESRLRWYYQRDESIEDDYDDWAERYVSDAGFREDYHDRNFGSGWDED